MSVWFDFFTVRTVQSLVEECHTVDKFGLAVVTDSRTAHETVAGFFRSLVDRRCGGASDGGVAGSLGSHSLV